MYTCGELCDGRMGTRGLERELSTAVGWARHRRAIRTGPRAARSERSSSADTSSHQIVDRFDGS